LEMPQSAFDPKRTCLILLGALELESPERRSTGQPA
jgi:hypothetical protein